MKREMGKLNIVRRVKKKDSLPSLTIVIESSFLSFCNRPFYRYGDHM